MLVIIIKNNITIVFYTNGATETYMNEFKNLLV